MAQTIEGTAFENTPGWLFLSFNDAVLNRMLIMQYED